MYPYPHRSQSQAPAPPSAPPYPGRTISASQSPEQSRAQALGPPIGGADYGGRQSLGPPPGHDGYVPWHAQHSRQRSGASASLGHPPSPQHDPRSDYYGPPQLPRREHQQHRSDDFGRPPPPWMEERGYASGRRTPIDERLPPPPGYSGGSGGYGGPPGHAYAPHPASPSRRPRTPPSLSRPGGSGIGGPGGAMPWDPASTGPMSAPPSMVPRMRPGHDGMAPPGPPPPSQQHGSPTLPGPGGPAAASRDGRQGHARLPSWGPHSASYDVPPVSPRQEMPRGGIRDPRDAPYRGAADPYARGTELPRKRPASDSPPNAEEGFAPQQASPSQRDNVMSMSSILGPSPSGRASSSAAESASGYGASTAEKRRRLEGPPSAIKSEDSRAAGSKDYSAGRQGAGVPINPSESTASNLVRRKWSGPIAEEAAQQAAAWRAQEQGRYGPGSSRSPKVGGLAPLPGATDGATPPFGATSRPRAVSPVPDAGSTHRRQRSDGQVLPVPVSSAPATDARGNAVRPAATRAPPSPGQQRSMPSNPPFKSPKPNVRRQASPPPMPMSSQAPQPMYGPPPPQHQPAYQPSYHAYDSQGRPVEIDVDEVRGGAFAGHGGLPPPHMLDPAYRHGMPPGYEEPHMRRPPMPTSAPSPVPSRPAPPAKQPAAPPRGAQDQKAAPSKSASAQRRTPGPPSSQLPPSSPRGVPVPTGPIRECDVKAITPRQRSPTPVLPGPAKGLLPPHAETRSELQPQRPVVPSKDFNHGPRVDNDAVFAALQDIAQEKRVLTVEDEAVSEKAKEGSEPTTSRVYELHPHGAFVGSFIYDASQSPLLPGNLLRRNIGALVEVRVSGQALGIGPTRPSVPADAALSKEGAWSLGLRAVPEGAEPEQLANGSISSVTAGDLQGAAAEDAAAEFWNAKSLLKRKLWGTDVYTDDSDIVAMLLHAGWINGPMLQDVPSWVPPGRAVLAWRHMTRELSAEGRAKAITAPDSAPDDTIAREKELQSRAARRAATCDLTVMLRIAPKLIAYKGSQRAGVRSRSWGNTHDGVSLLIESVTLQPAGYASNAHGGMKSTKQRVERLSELRLLGNVAGEPAIAASHGLDDGAGKQGGEKNVVAAARKLQLRTGRLVDILSAARIHQADAIVSSEDDKRRFWEADLRVDAKAA